MEITDPVVSVQRHIAETYSSEYQGARGRSIAHQRLYFSMVCIIGIIEETVGSCLGCKRPWVRIPPSRLLESRIYGHRRGARFHCVPHRVPHSPRKKFSN